MILRLFFGEAYKALMRRSGGVKYIKRLIRRTKVFGYL
jgi:hypothetical protein